MNMQQLLKVLVILDFDYEIAKAIQLFMNAKSPVTNILGGQDQETE